MLKKIITSLFCFLSTVVYAQNGIPAFEMKKEVACTDTASLLTSIGESKWKEHPMWLGKSSTSRVSIFVNQKTGTWTIVQFNEKVACILEVGTDSELLLGEPT